MYPRLRLLRDFLSNDGILFVSCDENEFHTLRMLLDSIFKPQNYAATLVWNTEGNTDNQFQFKVNHEYVLVYFSDHRFKQYAVGDVIDPNTPEDSNLRAGFADNNITKNGVKNPPTVIELPVGFPANLESLNLPGETVDEAFFVETRSEAMISKTIQEKYGISQIPVRLDEVLIKDGKLAKPCRLYSGWANAKKLDAFLKNDFEPIAEGEDELRFYLNRNGCIRYRKSRKSARNILTVLRNLGTTEKSRTYLSRMGIEFDYPKPVELIKYLLKIGAFNEDAIVMDSFAGSGTTGEAVFSLNNEDDLKRSFLLAEMDEGTASQRTSKRLNQILAGYSYKDSNGKDITVQPMNGGFRYCRLGVPLFNEFGDIDGGVTFPDLAAHVFFAETGAPIPAKATGNYPYLGQYQDKAVYLLFSPAEAGFAREASGNVLTPDTLASLPTPPEGFEGGWIIYGEGCTVGKERLAEAGVTFKQIPYQIEGA
ncbi:MAG: site-specific DNA-methyltransferase, partial [Hyphomicrobiales bacterium]